MNRYYVIYELRCRGEHPERMATILSAELVNEETLDSWNDEISDFYFETDKSFTIIDWKKLDD